LNLSHQTVHDILTEELDMRKIRVNLVSKNLTNKQKKKAEGMCAWTFLNASKMTKMFSNMS